MTPCWYLDSSAVVKLVIAEAESSALRRSISNDTVLATSELALTEVLRAVAHLGPLAMARAVAVVGYLDQLGVTRSVLDAAGRIDLPGLRSLDAVHLASARLLDHQLAAFVTYDLRQAQAALALGLPVLSPGTPEPPELEDFTP